MPKRILIILLLISLSLSSKSQNLNLGSVAHLLGKDLTDLNSTLTSRGWSLDNSTDSTTTWAYGRDAFETDKAVYWLTITFRGANAAEANFTFNSTQQYSAFITELKKYKAGTSKAYIDYISTLFFTPNYVFDMRTFNYQEGHSKFCLWVEQKDAFVDDYRRYLITHPDSTKSQ